MLRGGRCLLEGPSVVCLLTSHAYRGRRCWLSCIEILSCTELHLSPCHALFHVVYIDCNAEKYVNLGHCKHMRTCKGTLRAGRTTLNTNVQQQQQQQQPPQTFVPRHCCLNARCSTRHRAQLLKLCQMSACHFMCFSPHRFWQCIPKNQYPVPTPPAAPQSPAATPTPTPISTPVVTKQPGSQAPAPAPAVGDSVLAPAPAVEELPPALCEHLVDTWGQCGGEGDEGGVVVVLGQGVQCKGLERRWPMVCCLHANIFILHAWCAACTHPLLRMYMEAACISSLVSVCMVCCLHACSSSSDGHDMLLACILFFLCALCAACMHPLLLMCMVCCLHAPSSSYVHLDMHNISTCSEAHCVPANTASQIALRCKRCCMSNSTAQVLILQWGHATCCMFSCLQDDSRT